VEACNEGLNVPRRDERSRFGLHFARWKRPSVRSLANLTTSFALPIAMEVRQSTREQEDGQRHQSKRQGLIQAKSRPVLVTHPDDHILLQAAV
jgi:hypothetical protein